MDWILGVVVFLIVNFLLVNYRKKKRKQKTLLDLRNNWGKSKSKERFYFTSIEKYFRNNNEQKKAFHTLSDRCASDIDLNEVFKVVDRTSSKIGQQYLYYKLRTIQDQGRLQDFSDLTTLFEENEDLRVKAQFNLKSLNSNDSYAFESLVTSQPIEKPKIIWLIYTLSILSFSFIVLGFLYPIFFIFLLPVFVTNMVFHYKNKWEVSNYLDGVSQLSKARIVTKNLMRYPQIKEQFSDTSFLKEIEKISLKTAFISFEKKVDNEFAIAFWVLSECIKVLFNFEYILFYSFIESITKRKEDLKNLYHFIGEIDSAISTASLKASEYAICTPKFEASKKLSVKEIYHPLIENCTVNDISLEDKSLLLTGSNMSGKTTFIRSVSINSVLAQTLNICFAKAYTAPFFKLFSSVRITDDILENTSYYLEEVLTIKELIHNSKSKTPCLFVLDEIFKGTNTVERVSGGKAILSYLNKGNNVVLVSTHDLELTDILHRENFDLFHFSEQIQDNQLRFDHKLKAGKLKNRNAIKILELYDYPSEVIQDAKRTEKITFTNNA